MVITNVLCFHDKRKEYTSYSLPMVQAGVLLQVITHILHYLWCFQILDGEY